MEIENTLWEQNEVIRILSSRPGTAYQEADEEHRAEFRSWVRQLLAREEVTVEFVKSDGTMRTMRCTLDPDRFSAPNTVINVTTDLYGRPRSSRKQSDEVGVQTVWDLDANQWRSFRYDRLKRINFSLGL